ncbi:MAG: NAD+ synthase, partial [Planctomycetota bacterium]|nr:NAD+ synthase [Planctomycetota bacterium]
MPRYCLAQINATVGDLEGNAERIRAAQEAAMAQKADLTIFPELALTGYPPEDLLLKPRFIERCAEVFRTLSAVLPGHALIGLPWRDDRGFLRNAAALVSDNRVQEMYFKCLLPNYAVFDEQRYFAAGEAAMVFALPPAKTACAHTIGVTICEDAWS